MALKRKIESKQFESESKASKVKVIESKKKPLTKNELMVKYKALEEKHETLLNKDNSNLTEIARLKKEKSPKVFKAQDCQTKADTEYVEISCT